MTRPVRPPVSIVAPQHPTIRGSYPAPRVPNETFSVRQDILHRVDGGVHERIRDVGRVAVWTVSRLRRAGIEETVTVESVRRQTLVGKGVSEVSSTVVATGWNFWHNSQGTRHWTLMPDGRVLKYMQEGDRNLIINRDPNDYIVDFRTGELDDDVAGPLTGYGLDRSGVISMLDLCGVELGGRITDDHIGPIMRPLLNKLAEYRAAEGWHNALDEFMLANELELPTDPSML